MSALILMSLNMVTPVFVGDHDSRAVIHRLHYIVGGFLDEVLRWGDAGVVVKGMWQMGPLTLLNHVDFVPCRRDGEDLLWLM